MCKCSCSFSKSGHIHQKDCSGRGHRGGNSSISSTIHTGLVLTLNPFYTSFDEQLLLWCRSLLLNFPGAQVTWGPVCALWPLGAVTCETQWGGCVLQHSSRGCGGCSGSSTVQELCQTDCTADLGWAADLTCNGCRLHCHGLDFCAAWRLVLGVLWAFDSSMEGHLGTALGNGGDCSTLQEGPCKTSRSS